MATTSSMRGGRNRKFKAEINVVPYIDVMLVLLVIFMVVAPLQNPQVINLPTAGKSTQPPSEYLQISIQADGRGSIGLVNKNGKSESPLEFANRSEMTKKLKALHAEKPELAALIAADREVKYDEVIQAVSEARKLGIARVGLATK
ncbi:ExbD/TolR family protein [Massilia sp. W12]|uniref:ExbD/TolR family protein n=1 Tax=Massilia sp. W12 TaxID=3126507 RepID=UPI0030CED8FB